MKEREKERSGGMVIEGVLQSLMALVLQSLCLWVTEKKRDEIPKRMAAL